MVPFYTILKQYLPGIIGSKKINLQEITPVKGGSSANVFLYQQWIIKCIDLSKPFTIRKQICINNQLASSYQLAPHYYGHDEHYQFMVLDYIIGQPLTIQDLQQQHWQKKIAAQFELFHNLPTSGFIQAKTTEQMIVDINTKLEANENLVDLDYAYLLEVNQWLGQQIQPLINSPCLIHNDTNLSNFIKSGQSLYLLDWDDAGILGDRYIDFADIVTYLPKTAWPHFLALNQQDDIQHLELCHLQRLIFIALWSIQQYEKTQQKKLPANAAKVTIDLEKLSMNSSEENIQAYFAKIATQSTKIDCLSKYRNILLLCLSELMQTIKKID